MKRLSKKDRPPDGHGFIYAAYAGGGLLKIGKTITSPQQRLTGIRGRFWDHPNHPRYQSEIQALELTTPILCCPLTVHHLAERAALRVARQSYKQIHDIGNEFFYAPAFNYWTLFDNILEEIQNGTIRLLNDVEFPWENALSGEQPLNTALENDAKLYYEAKRIEGKYPSRVPDWEATNTAARNHFRKLVSNQSHAELMMLPSTAPPVGALTWTIR